MKEKILTWKDNTLSFWNKRTKSQKGIFVGSMAIAILIVAAIFIYSSSSSRLVPLYNNLSLSEVGQIKEELDARGVNYELGDAGTTIRVPEAQVDSLLVELAGQGIPNSGSIDYSFFSENASWGITDNEFNVMKLDAMQTELAKLITGIDGIENAEVMINLPQEPVFVNEATEEASASIVLHTQPGHQFQGNQIDSLYLLVSKAVPNLPQDNIVIMNQYSEYFDQNSSTVNGSQDVHTYQQNVKKDIERDIQSRLQQMLGAMVGMDNVVVSVTSDIDFTQENRVEELVEPIDLENMEGLPVSIETIHETYSGNPPAGGTVGTGEEDTTATYQEINDGDGEYELAKETINNEFNRIRREIVESPYKIRDLGIQVAVNRIAGTNENEVEYLSQQEEMAVEDGINSILHSIIQTSIDDGYGEVVPEEKASLVFQEFNHTPSAPAETVPAIPGWLYITGAILLAIILILIILLFKNRKDEAESVEEETVAAAINMEVPEIPENEESESTVRKKQLEKMAKEKPEDFAKLLRSWIGED
ncbi:flagellar basal-body MS-ring/collar protein FliF [Virgibacillus kimchii]